MQLYLHTQVKEVAKEKWRTPEAYQYIVTLTQFSDAALQWFDEEPERLKLLSPEQFQNLIADRLEQMGLGVQLSRSAKVLQQILKPEARGENACFSECFLFAEPQHPLGRLFRQLVHRSSLAIGCDEPFPLAPQLVHGIQLGPLLRQPDQFDGQLCGELLGSRCRVGRCFIQQEPDRSGTPVTTANCLEEHLHIRRSFAPALHHDAVAGAHVDSAEQDTLGVASRDGNPGLLAFPSPDRA